MCVSAGEERREGGELGLLLPAPGAFVGMIFSRLDSLGGGGGGRGGAQHELYAWTRARSRLSNSGAADWSRESY